MNIKELTSHLLEYSGDTPKELRTAVEALACSLNGGNRKASTELPEVLQKFVSKVSTDAYKTLDSDFDQMRELYSEPEIFELLLATTTGSANGRLEQALAFLESDDGG